MRRYVKELQADRGPGPGRHGRPLPPGPDGEHPQLHPPQARAGGGHLPAPVARAGAPRHVRDLRLPGRHHDRRHRHGRLHRPRGGQPVLRHPQEEGERSSTSTRRSSRPGAKRKGIPPAIVDQVFAAFEPFARYGFNKAHATCYGLIAYQTAYLKANYPVEFMTAVLNGFRGARREGRRRWWPSAGGWGSRSGRRTCRRSQALFTVETDAAGAPEAIRFGLVAVKNVGEGAIESIVAAREGRSRDLRRDAGRSPSLDDLCRRVDLRTVNKRVLESLVKAGAHAPRSAAPGALLDRLDAALETGGAASARRGRGAGDPLRPVRRAGWRRPQRIAGRPSAIGPDEDEIPQRERLRWEKELLGLYLSEHPLGEIADLLPDYVTAYTGDLAEEDDQARGDAGRDHPGRPSCHHPGRLDHARREPRGPAGDRGGRRLPQGLRGDGERLGGGRRGPGQRPRRPPRRRGASSCARRCMPGTTRVRMGPVAFSAERDRLLRGRGAAGGAATGPGMATATAHADGATCRSRTRPGPRTISAAARRRGRRRPSRLARRQPRQVRRHARSVAVEPRRRSPPRDHAPPSAAPATGAAAPYRCRSTPRGAAARSRGRLSSRWTMEQLLPAIESVTSCLRGRPGLAARAARGSGRRRDAPDPAAAPRRVGRRAGRGRARAAGPAGGRDACARVPVES